MKTQGADSATSMASTPHGLQREKKTVLAPELMLPPFGLTPSDVSLRQFWSDTAVQPDAVPSFASNHRMREARKS